MSESPAHPDAPDASPPGQPRNEPKPVTLAQFGPVGPLALIASFLPVAGSIALFARMGVIAGWLREHAGAGVAAYMAGFILCTGFALLPTYASSALGGYAFGAVTGSLAAIVSCVLGASIGNVIARRASGDHVLKVIASRPQWAAIHQALLGGESRSWIRTVITVTLLRLPFNSPFAVMNLMMASTRVPWSAYLLGTLLGMAPRTAIVAYIGATVHGELSKDALQNARPAWLIWVIVLGWLAVLVIIGAIAKQALTRLARTTAPAQP